MHIQSSASPARARGRANKVARPSRYRYRCSANVYESTSTRAAGDGVFRCTYHKRTCLDVWSAYAALCAGYRPSVLLNYIAALES